MQRLALGVGAPWERVQARIKAYAALAYENLPGCHTSVPRPGETFQTRWHALVEQLFLLVMPLRNAAEDREALIEQLLDVLADDWSAEGEAPGSAVGL